MIYKWNPNREHINIHSYSDLDLKKKKSLSILHLDFSAKFSKSTTPFLPWFTIQKHIGSDLEQGLITVSAKSWLLHPSTSHGSWWFEHNQARLSHDSPFIHQHKHQSASVSTYPGQEITKSTLSSLGGKFSTIAVHEIVLCVW
jgi:hypothetical protein